MATIPSSVLDGVVLIHRPRPKPLPPSVTISGAQIPPAVCVSSMIDSQQLAITTSNLLAAVPGTQLESPLISPVFVDTTNNIENPHSFRIASGGATSAMLHTDRWFGYRHERNSSSSSDSGLAFSGLSSPPGNTLGLSSPSLSLSISPISPPGLSPLQISTDSAFSTPTSSSNNRIRTHFTFDHLPSPNLPKKEEPQPPPSTNSLQYASNALTEILLRRLSEQQRFQEQLVAAISNSNADTLHPGASSVFKSESLPMIGDLTQPLIKPLPFSASDNATQQQLEMEALLHNFNLIQQVHQPSTLTPTQHVPIGRTASLNTKTSSASNNPPIFVTPQLPFQKQTLSQKPLLLQRPPLKTTLSSPLNTINTLPPTNPETGLRRTESTKRKLLRSGGSKDIEEPKSKNVATNSAGSTAEGTEEDHQQFICRFCNKDFRRPDILSRHLRRHTGEKPFTCDVCCRNFSRSDHLRTHRRTHTNEKPYACTVCHYAARRRDVLTRHMATRHQQKAGPSFPQQRRGRRPANAQPLPKSPLAISVGKQPNDEKEEERKLEVSKSSTTDDEDSNIFIDVTNVDSDNDDSCPKPTLDENKTGLAEEECEK